jgi:hypothetical protein
MLTALPGKPHRIRSNMKRIAIAVTGAAVAALISNTPAARADRVELDGGYSYPNGRGVPAHMSAWGSVDSDLSKPIGRLTHEGCVLEFYGEGANNAAVRLPGEAGAMSYFDTATAVSGEGDGCWSTSHLHVMTSATPVGINFFDQDHGGGYTFVEH